MSLQSKETPRPQFYRLLKHPFVLSVLKNEKIASEPLSEQAMQAYRLGQEPEFSFTPEMAYHHNVNYYLTNLINTIERIEQVPIFLRRFPNSKFFSENNVTLYKWIKYHYANFLIMSVSLYDIALLLTNEIFMLGVEPRFCNEKSVAKHRLVKATRVKISLDNLGQVVDEDRNSRNLFIHRGHTPSMGFMDKLDIYDFLQKTEKELGIEKSDNDSMKLLSNPIILRDLYKAERKKLVTQIEQRTDVFIELLLELFDSQKPIYDAVSRQWKS